MEDTVKMVTIRKLSRETKSVLDSLPCVVTSFGKPVAVIMPYDNRQPTTEMPDLPASEQAEDTRAVSQNIQPEGQGELESFS